MLVLVNFDFCGHFLHTCHTNIEPYKLPAIECSSKSSMLAMAANTGNLRNHYIFPLWWLMDARCYKNLDIFRYVQNEFQNAHFEDSFQHIRYMPENTHFSVFFFRPSESGHDDGLFRTRDKPANYYENCPPQNCTNLFSKGNQSHEHVGTKQCHNSNAHKIFEAHHPIFAVGVQVHGMVSNRNCGSRGSQSVANPGQVFELAIRAARRNWRLNKASNHLLTIGTK